LLLLQLLAWPTKTMKMQRAQKARRAMQEIEATERGSGTSHPGRNRVGRRSPTATAQSAGQNQKAGKDNILFRSFLFDLAGIRGWLVGLNSTLAGLGT
jgi:hypothetical protein